MKSWECNVGHMPWLALHRGQRGSGSGRRRGGRLPGLACCTMHRTAASAVAKCHPMAVWASEQGPAWGLTWPLRPLRLLFLRPNCVPDFTADQCRHTGAPSRPCTLRDDQTGGGRSRVGRRGVKGSRSGTRVRWRHAETPGTPTRPYARLPPAACRRWPQLRSCHPRRSGAVSRRHVQVQLPERLPVAALLHRQQAAVDLELRGCVLLAACCCWTVSWQPVAHSLLHTAQDRQQAPPCAVAAVENGHIKRLTDEDIQSSVLEVGARDGICLGLRCPAAPLRPSRHGQRACLPPRL